MTIPGTNITVQKCIEVSSDAQPLELMNRTDTKCIFTTPEGITIITEPTIDKKCISQLEDKVPLIEIEPIIS
jgi:hypothetical protein